MPPLILITNDDGVLSPGLKASAEALSALGDVLIAAPNVQQTGMGRSLPIAPDTGIIETLTLDINGKPHPAYGVHGSPALAVRSGILELAPRRPDLCVSGINYGENVGASISISGTIGAAMEAAALGVPALASSFQTDVSTHHAETYATENWEIAAYWTQFVAAQILKNGLPPQIDLLNLNIPAIVTRNTELRFTIQSRNSYYAPHGVPGRDFSKPFRFPYGVELDKSQIEPTSDIYAYRFDQVVSVTPLVLDNSARVNLADWSKSFLG